MTTERKEVYRVEEDDEGLRLDVFLAEQNIIPSRSFVQKLIKSGNVLVNSKIMKPSYSVEMDDEIDVNIPEPQVIHVKAENIPINIVYQDKQIIVINKERGMVVHPAPGNWDGTLVNALLYHCGDLSGIGGVLRPGIVHRLDKDTSGLLVVAKTDKAHLSLSAQIKARSVQRKYIAILCGRLKEQEGTINLPIGRNPSHRKKMAVVDNGRHAVTHYKIIDYYKGLSLAQATLETGRTHQIRVHMAYIGHPVLGDDKYGGKIKTIKFNGHALHAKALAFVHPHTKEDIEFTAEIPQDMQKILS